MTSTIVNKIKNKINWAIDDYCMRIFSFALSNEAYLKWRFKKCLGYSLRLNNPQTFNEKLQWLKFNNMHPEFTNMVDKIEAKKYVANIIGDKFIIPTLGVWDTIDEIDWNSLPNQFVIKVTSDSGGIVVCKDKASLDIKSARKKQDKSFSSHTF